MRDGEAQHTADGKGKAPDREEVRSVLADLGRLLAELTGEPAHIDESRLLVEPTGSYAPASLGAELVEKSAAALESRRKTIEASRKTIQSLSGEFEAAGGRLARSFAARFGEVEIALHQLESRAADFVDESLQPLSALTLLNSADLERRFERLAMRDALRRVDASVLEIAEWILECAEERREEIRKRFGRQSSPLLTDLLASLSTSAAIDRDRLDETMSRASDSILKELEPTGLAAKLSALAKDAVLIGGAAAIGGVGVAGAIVLSADDTSGRFLGLAVGAVGLALGAWVFPRRRQILKTDIGQRASRLKLRLREILQQRFDHELAIEAARFNDLTAVMLSRFKKEERLLSEQKAELDKLSGAVGALGRGSSS